MLTGGQARAAADAAGCSSQLARGCGRTFSPQAGPQLFFTCSPYRHCSAPRQLRFHLQGSHHMYV
jgi:hypothetical protein